jgi:hypothetical protein
MSQSKEGKESRVFTVFSNIKVFDQLSEEFTYSIRPSTGHNGSRVRVDPRSQRRLMAYGAIAETLFSPAKIGVNARFSLGNAV